MLLIVVFSEISFSLQAQNICFATEQANIILPDSVIVIPSSIVVKNAQNEFFSFEYDKVSGFLRLTEHVDASSYEICFNYVLKKSGLVKAPVSIDLYDSTVLFKDELSFRDKNLTTQEALGLSGLKVDGAFMRSVSGGGQQSVFMHSVMDLSISGKISDELMLQARLTDQQMPFEPEGNTQRLQDFDRVNVKIKHRNWSLQGGDILVKSEPSSHFLRYNRQVQGIGISTNKLSVDTTASHTEAVTSFSRSKTGMQLIEPIEGVLGPYRIKGPQNEPFIFLLAGSEKVYLDGKLLQRGMENDYIIDYNAAEISFNATLYINKFSRIQIEFEYSDQQYARNVNIFKHQQSINRLNIRAGIFQEADQPNRALYDLSFDDMEALSELDKDASVGEIPAFDSVVYQQDKVLYARMDTVTEGNTYSIFHFSKDPERAFYQVYFSLVGENKGNYIVSNSAENAVIYQWVAPLNGVPQGNYAPLKQVALPKKQRVISLGADYQLKNKDVISFDFASSEKTANRFNPQGSKNTGNAFSLGYKSGSKKLSIGNGFSYQYHLTYEYLDSAFLPIQVFRSVEFNRDWGVEQAGNYQAGQEHLIGFGNKLSNDKQTLTYQTYWRQKEQFGQGHQQHLQYQYEGDWTVHSSLFYMQNDGGANDTQWIKTLLDGSYTQWKITPGYRFQMEKHSAFQADSLINSFMNFENHQLYLRKQDSSRWSFSLTHDFRVDYQIFEHEFQVFERSQTTQITTGLQYNQQSSLDLSMTKRSINAAHESSVAEDFYQGAVQWSTAFWEGNIVQRFYYQTGTGRVLERNYFFQEVARRMGTHSWSDLNGNGERELNEFFEDQTEYGDRNFIKILTMGDNYQTAYINTARYQLQVRMPGSWRKSNSLLRYIGKISAQFQANLETRNLFENWENRISPFVNNSNQDELLSGKQFVKANMYYNRGGKASLDFGLIESLRKQLLMNGFEGNQMKSYHINGMWNAFNAWNIMTGYRLSSHHSYSEVVAQRDFSYNAQWINPQLQWQGSKNWRAILSYESQIKVSPDEAIGGKVLVDQLSISNKFIHSNGGIFESKVGFVNVDSDLQSDVTPLAYEMFEGLRAGKNYIWNLSVRQKIIGDLNLVLQYGGRKSTDSHTIHNGSVQLSALF
ncbi:hypothetical protein JKA74_01665 [Marivirga sp. S37H4]|uniref:Uncharacterized protein n=1 Tax=Marivirga aurantiaca TaxID=2802615 RepID=A0A935C6G5_9BACT|nr:hypothetical protein [Marivirga aurantiaca]MBK6263727.1 hypothetical protein [Marivirga aurantiaca]